MAAPTVQYLLVRNDLVNYPTGALIAQAVHASTLALFEHPDEVVQAYLSLREQMTTVVLQCTRAELVELDQYLTEHQIKHALWIEHPENEPTALALHPLPKTHWVVRERLKRFRVYR